VSRKRPDIRMSSAEIGAFIAQESRVVVVALDGDAPLATIGSAEPIDGRWKVTLPVEDDVARLIAADDRTCVLIDRFPSYYEIKGVAAHGPARKKSADNAVLSFEVDLEDVVSFDFDKLPRQGTGSGRTSP
jgi:hypothetical protein